MTHVKDLTEEAKKNLNRFLEITREMNLTTRMSKDGTAIELLDEKTSAVLMMRPISDFL
jgi:hypothetical protein